MFKLQQLAGLAMLAVGLIIAVPAQAALILYAAHLTGPNEAPPNASPGVGDAIVGLDTTAHLLTVDVSFNGLLFPTIAAHIHCCIAPPGATGVATAVPTSRASPWA